MLPFRDDDARARLPALERAQAIIKFTPDGTILSANANFLTATGYNLDEVKGRNHALFVEASERDAPAYRTFWEELRQGASQARSFRRVAKGGREIWIQASYNNPILDRRGRVVRIVKFATDITAQMGQSLDAAGRIAAASAHGIDLEVVKAPEAKRGLVLLPRRWVVERSFAWATRCRRLIKDYERYASTLAGLHMVAFVCLVLRQSEKSYDNCITGYRLLW